MLLMAVAERMTATGFSVNGGAPQTGYVIGTGVNSGDSVVGTETFTGAFSKNPANLYHGERVLVASNANITSPGIQPYYTNTATFTGSDALIYTNFTYYQGLCYFSAGSLTNYGWLNYSNVDNVPGFSTFLTEYDNQIGGSAPGVTGNFNRNYYWGNGVYLNDANVASWGGPVYVQNGATNNSLATISATVGGTNQVNVAGLNVWAYYGASSSPDVTELNYGMISGAYKGSYNGTAAGIYNLTDYGGQNITNFPTGIITASAPYYADAIFAWCNYGSVNIIQSGTVNATSTGGQNGNTTGVGRAVGMDLFTYGTSTNCNINLLNSGTVTASVSASNSAIGYAVFCWANGGSFTYTNTGSISATCTAGTNATGNTKTFYGGGVGGPVNLFNSGTVTGNGNGGWAYGTEQDSGHPITIVNTGSIYHNTGLGVFVYGIAGGTATLTNSGSIYGGLEGIASEGYTGQMNIYDSGPVSAGSSNNNAMDLGPTNDTVHLYGLPNITGWMNGQGGSNVLDFELVGTLQKVNGSNPTQSTNLAAYNFNPSTGNSIVVSGQTYKWSNFYVTGSVTPPPILLATLASGSNALNLSWPIANKGWLLQSQTNASNVGLSTNWQAVAGSTATNQMAVPLSMTNGCVFYRLIL